MMTSGLLSKIFHLILLLLSLTSATEMDPSNTGQIQADGKDGLPQQSERVVSGWIVPRSNHKYMVLIQTTASCGTKAICGGTVIGPNHLLTAASCFDQKPYTEIKIFMKTYTTDPLDADAVIRGVDNKHIFVHPNYARDSMGTPINDIAILAFRPCLYYYFNSDLINKVTLPELGVTNPYLYYSGQAVGWGYTSNDGPESKQMRATHMSVGSLNDCRLKWGAAYDPAYHLCAARNEGWSACKGDEGGPIISEGIQIGITSFFSKTNEGKLQCEKGAIFSRVTNYVGWIQDTLKTKVNW